MSVIFDALRELDHEKPSGSREGFAEVSDAKDRHGFSAWARRGLLLLALGVTSVIGFSVWNNYSKQLKEVAAEKNIQTEITRRVDFKSMPQDTAVTKPVTADALEKPILIGGRADERVVTVKGEKLSQLKTEATVQSTKQPSMKQGVTTSQPVSVAVSNQPRTYAVKQTSAASANQVVVKARQTPAVRQGKSSFQMQYNISQLIPRLKLAMAQKNEALVAKYLDELAEMSGDESVFVNKMRAYWALSNGHFDEAFSRYQSIIAQNPNDIESQMNAASAEMQLKHFENAYKRLVMLAGKHPNDARVSSMLDRLKAIYPL